MAQCCIRLGDKKRAAEYYKKKLELLKTDWDVKFGEELDSIKEKIKELQ